MTTLEAPAEFAGLARPGRIGSLNLRNRVVKSPQATATANQDGSVTQRTVDHYHRLGEGGIGLVMVEYSYVDDDAEDGLRERFEQRGHEVSVVGSADRLGRVFDAIHSSFFSARNV